MHRDSEANVYEFLGNLKEVLTVDCINVVGTFSFIKVSPNFVKSTLIKTRKHTFIYFIIIMFKNTLILTDTQSLDIQRHLLQNYKEILKKCFFVNFRDVGNTYKVPKIQNYTKVHHEQLLKICIS